MSAEETELHTRLLRCDLIVDASRAWWARSPADREGPRATVAQRAFEGFWFGPVSLDRASDLIRNLRLRFDAFPAALRALSAWPDMPAETRRLICHWHTQLTDPLYRDFTGAWLPDHRVRGLAGATRDEVVAWVAARGHARWTTATRIQFASKLLGSAKQAGIIDGSRGTRGILAPRVPDEALEYLCYLLRQTPHQGGDLRQNPYMASVGLTGALLDERLRRLRGLQFRQMANLVDYGWSHADLDAWSAARSAP